MAKLKDNPNASLDSSLPQVTSSIPVEADLIKALESPYEAGSIENQIFVMCKESHASIEELSTILSLPVEYLEKEYGSVIERGFTACRIMLRRQQLRAAQEGDSKSLTWLGKQLLGQQDKMQLDIPMTIMVNTGIQRDPNWSPENKKD